MTEHDDVAELIEQLANLSTDNIVILLFSISKAARMLEKQRAEIKEWRDAARNTDDTAKGLLDEIARLRAAPQEVN